MQKRIYVLIEVKDRELLAKTIFAFYMMKFGYSVVLGKKSSLFAHHKYFKSGIFYFKGMGPKNLKPMKYLKQFGHSIIGYDEEGLVMNQVKSISNRINKDCLNLVDYFFTVGKVQQNNTLKIYPNSKKKIFEIGNPRFDLMKKKYNFFYKEEIKALKEKYGKFVFFPTKFTIINNHLFQTIPKDIKNDLDILKNDFEDQKKIKKKLFKFLNTFPKKNPDINIVIKPHPVERKFYWKKILKKINCKNLYLDDKFSTNALIYASEFNVSSNCHTALESYLAGKPTVNIRSDVKNSQVTSKLIRAISGKEVLHISELDKIILDWFKNNKKFKNNSSFNSKKILNSNIRNIKVEASSLLKQKIDQIKINSRVNTDKYSNLFFFYLFKIIRKIKNFFYNYNKSKKELNFYSIKFPSLIIQEIEEKIEILCKYQNFDKKKVRVKEIYPGCFCIEKI